MDCDTQITLTDTQGDKSGRIESNSKRRIRNLAVVIARVHAMIAAAWAVPGQVVSVVRLDGF